MEEDRVTRRVTREIASVGELRPGAIYAVRVNADIAPERAMEIAHALSAWGNRQGIAFMVFESTLELINPQELGDELLRRLAGQTLRTYADVSHDGGQPAGATELGDEAGSPAEVDSKEGRT